MQLPCKPGAADLNGCTASGETNNGDVWIWVGFRRGDASDALGASVTTAKGDPIAEGAIDLARIGCKSNCAGAGRTSRSRISRRASTSSG